MKGNKVKKTAGTTNWRNLRIRIVLCPFVFLHNEFTESLALIFSQCLDLDKETPIRAI